MALAVLHPEARLFLNALQERSFYKLHKGTFPVRGLFYTGTYDAADVTLWPSFVF